MFHNRHRVRPADGADELSRPVPSHFVRNIRAAVSTPAAQRGKSHGGPGHFSLPAARRTLVDTRRRLGTGLLFLRNLGRTLRTDGGNEDADTEYRVAQLDLVTVVQVVLREDNRGRVL